EQEEALARRRRHPVGIAAAGIEECRLRGARGLFGEMDQLVLDLERAQGFEFAQCQDVGHDLLLLAGLLQSGWKCRRRRRWSRATPPLANLSAPRSTS